MDRCIAAASEASDKLGAFKALAKEYIDNAGRFGYYAKEDLRDLETVYKGGETTDAAGLAMYLREMARFSMPLKQGKPIKLEHIGSTHAYQVLLDNGSTLKASGSAIGYATDGMATDQSYNWQIVRKGSTDKFTICNMQTKQYLDPSASGQLSSSPVEVSVAVRNDDKGFVISNGGKSIECNLLDNYYVKHIK